MVAEGSAGRKVVLAQIRAAARTATTPTTSGHQERGAANSSILVDGRFDPPRGADGPPPAAGRGTAGRVTPESGVGAQPAGGADGCGADAGGCWDAGSRLGSDVIGIYATRRTSPGNDRSPVDIVDRPASPVDG